MKENPIRDKSYDFALRIIEVYKQLTQNEREFVLSKQLLRSGTSIGANAEEAIGAQSKKDFLSKISISYKEARETKYWIRLLRDSNYINQDKANNLIQEVDELLKLMGAIISTTKKRLVIEKANSRTLKN
ncbi:four helix bundle protein [Sunxiuqinia sp. A32]|uniref:four helix bundle protein n=1 Tax=Sunxiuqinia sp. A32 TaxID=3461496 RepID=UPI0040452184